MGRAPRTYACIQIIELEIPFTFNKSRQLRRSIKGYAKLQQIHHQDLLFADFIIADITSGLKFCLLAEIAPCTIYPLYGIGIKFP